MKHTVAHLQNWADTVNTHCADKDTSVHAIEQFHTELAGAIRKQGLHQNNRVGDKLAEKFMGAHRALNMRKMIESLSARVGQLEEQLSDKLASTSVEAELDHLEEDTTHLEAPARRGVPLVDPPPNMR